MQLLNFSNIAVYEFDVDKDLVNSALDTWLSQSPNFEPAGPLEKFSATSMGKIVDNGELRSPYYEPLFQVLNEKLNLVAEKHFFSKCLAINESWLTHASFGQSRGLHGHPCSVFSGLLYLTDHDKSHTIFELEDPFYNRWLPMMGPQVLKRNSYIHQYTPKIGKLLIWESTLLHRIKGHTDKTQRYTLAFNSWFHGVVSAEDTGRLQCNVVYR